MLCLFQLSCDYVTVFLETVLHLQVVVVQLVFVELDVPLQARYQTTINSYRKPLLFSPPYNTSYILFVFFFINLFDFRIVLFLQQTLIFSVDIKQLQQAQHVGCFPHTSCCTIQYLYFYINGLVKWWKFLKFKILTVSTLLDTSGALFTNGVCSKNAY